MPSSNSLSVAISTADLGPLPEFHNPEEDELHLHSGIFSTTRYLLVPPTLTTPFSITLTLHPGASFTHPTTPPDHLAITPIIDGLELPTELIILPLSPSGYPHSRTLSHIRYYDHKGTEAQKREMYFANMEITEDVADRLGDVEKANQLGEITVRLRRYLRTGTVEKAADTVLTKGTRANEKELKGRDIKHAVKLSAPQACEKFTLAQGVYLDTIDKPFAVFRFRYRGKGALQRLGLIPRSPSPEPKNNKGESQAEVKRVKGLTGIKEEKAKGHVKRERERSVTVVGDGPGPSKRVKAGFIDLTDD